MSEAKGPPSGRMPPGSDGALSRPGPGRALPGGLLTLALVLAAGLCWRLADPTARPGGGVALIVEKRMIMGTDVTITVRGADRSALERGLEAAFEELESVDRIMSIYRPASDLSRLNAARPGVPVAIEPTLAEVLQESQRFARLSGGAFDPGVLPVLALWREKARDGSEPTGPEVAQARAGGGIERLVVDRAASLAARPDAGARYDLGGIAKGHGVDRAITLLEKAPGLVGALVNAGGDLRAVGDGPSGRGWRIGVEAPAPVARSGENAAVERSCVLRVRDRAVSTSGPGRRGFVAGEQRRSHIIDPRTGVPLPFWWASSVTVVAADSTTADALATAISVLGPGEGLGLARRLRAEALVFHESRPGHPERFETPGFGALIDPDDGPAPRPEVPRP